MPDSLVTRLSGSEYGTPYASSGELSRAMPLDGQRSTIVKFENVEKSYGGQSPAVRDLDLEIRRGEFLTLLGPSGSGKTTTLMMLAGFEAPSRGAIYIDGELVHQVPPYQRNIGVVFQSYALFPHMSVAENIGFPLKMRGVARADLEARVKAILEMVKMGKFASRLPAQLSGGQQQRVALARALVFEPKLVLMDEPLGALDKQLREHMQIEIRHIHAELGVTVVYVTHDQAEALTMSDRVAVFQDGAIRQLATPEQVYEEPNSAFVAQFIGENNALPGILRQARPDGCVVELAGGLMVQVRGDASTPVGSKVILSLRPERISIDPDQRQANRIPAHVKDLIYFGDHARIHARLNDECEVVIKTPIQSFTGGLAAGRTITVGWARENCLVLPAE